MTPHSRPGKRRHTGHYWETETEAVSARNRKFESTSLQRRVHQTSPATLQTRGVGSPRECVFVHKWLLERKRSYLTEKGLFSRKAVKGDATEPINFIKEESHGTVYSETLTLVGFYQAEDARAELISARLDGS